MINKNNIILIGFMASGKTTVGKMLSKKLNMNFLDTDALIEKAEGLSIKYMFENYGEFYFREKEKTLTEKLLSVKNTVISTGGGTVISAENAANLKQIGTVIFLDTPLNGIEKRLKDAPDRPLNRDLSGVRQLYAERYNVYLNLANCIINSTEPQDKICSKIILSIYNKQ